MRKKTPRPSQPFNPRNVIGRGRWDNTRGIIKRYRVSDSEAAMLSAFAAEHHVTNEALILRWALAFVGVLDKARVQQDLDAAKSTLPALIPQA